MDREACGLLSVESHRSDTTERLTHFLWQKRREREKNEAERQRLGIASQSQTRGIQNHQGDLAKQIAAFSSSREGLSQYSFLLISFVMLILLIHDLIWRTITTEEAYVFQIEYYNKINIVFLFYVLYEPDFVDCYIMKYYAYCVFCSWSFLNVCVCSNHSFLNNILNIIKIPDLLGHE